MINRIAGYEPAVALPPGGPHPGQRRLPDYTRRPDGPSGPEWAGALGDTIERFIGDHPVLSLGVGLAVGIVIGCFIKRR